MKALQAAVLSVCIILVAGGAPVIRPGTGNPSLRLPRTSASQQQQFLSAANRTTTKAHTVRPRTK